MKRKSLKVTLSLLLLGILLITGSMATATEATTFYGAMPDNQRTPYADNLHAVWMEELTGVKIEMETYPSDVWQEKLSIMLASGDYPEFFYMADLTREAQTLYGRDSGTLLDLMPYIESGAMSNLKKLMDENPDIFLISNIDGAMYSLPFLFNDLNEPHFIINQSWLDALGLEAPTTLDEFTDVLRAFKNGDPNGNGIADEIPLTSGYNIYWLRPLITCFGLPATGLLEDENGTVYYSAQTQNYYDYLEWLAMAYGEGLIDSRVLTGTVNDEAILASANQNLVGMIYTAYASLVASDPLQYVGFVPVPYGDNELGVWPASITLVSGTFAVTDKCSDPATILSWVDNYYTDEFEILYWYGKEGVTYELAADGSWNWINIPEGMTSTEYQNTFSIQGMHYFPGMYSYWGTEHSSSEADMIMLQARKQLVPLTVKAISEYSYTSEEAESVSVISADINTYMDNYEAKVMSGELDLASTWDDFQATLVQMNIDKLISVTQDAVDRFYGK